MGWLPHPGAYHACHCPTDHLHYAGDHYTITTAQLIVSDNVWCLLDSSALHQAISTRWTTAAMRATRDAGWICYGYCGRLVCLR